MLHFWQNCNMRALTSLDAIAFAELLELCHTQAPDATGPVNGTFTKQRRGVRDYWYHRGYERPLTGIGRSTLTYVGIAGDPDVEARVATQTARHAVYRSRRALAARLRRSGLPAPQPIEGAILAALAEAGLFTSGSTLVGTAAFQTYGGILNARLQSYRTQDIDLAQPSGLKLGARQAPPDLLTDLKEIDASFAPFFHSAFPRLAAGIRNASGFGIEFLTPLRRTSSEPLAAVAGVPGLGAQKLRFLDYLIAEPVPSLVLHDAGTAVMVPQPMRYAVHKLMLTALRGISAGAATSPKSAKDLAQAELLIEAADVARAGVDLGVAWLDAWGRGPAWRKVLREGTLKLPPDSLQTLAAAALESAALSGLSCPFDGGDPRRALLGSGRA